ncbi:hypothetical protein GGS23DRAFT_292325 [Durotheca rogersii]|uniref:uncharacterized protein n=1 Tax=Durotheca rogersii TaxID=419775 RepID=UPI0022203DAE|nr:uncharacterized protein GGS23DRAFT_292325 [Durotheca rogersii]KAI5866853.1 hypothetical protein GGS23DRAFT_292325 [Durotheca rogersii]
MDQQPEVEILVHIEAPSRAADDVWYRSLATSYRDFESTARLDLDQLSISDLQNRPIGQPSLHTQSQGSTFSSQQLTGPLGSLTSPQASFRSAIDNAGSPRVPTGRIPGADSVGVGSAPMPTMTQSSWQTPSSLVEDSCLGNRINLAVLSTPTRVLEHYLQSFGSPSESSKGPSQPEAHRPAPGNPTENPNHRNPIRRPTPAVVGTPPLSVVPCTPQRDPSPELGRPVETDLAGEPPGESAPEPLQIPQSQGEVTSDNVVEETILVDSSDPASAAAEASSEPPPAGQQEPGPAAATSPRALSRAASDAGSRVSFHQQSAITVSFLSAHGYTYDSLELHAPPPPTSAAELGADSFVTPALAKLARDLDVARRYRPARQCRALRPFERGHWRLDCSAWEPQLKRDAWAYLANYVAAGTAGWGVWCARDPAFSSLRVYCWGAVAAHIYLLLYLASQRRILLTGGTWVDGEGVAVVITEARA